MVFRRGPDEPVLVREATQNDAEAISEVHAEAWRVAHRDLFETRWLSRFVDERRERWKSVMASREFVRNTLLVAERGDRIVAFVYLGPLDYGVREGEIFDLYAHPSAWGSGVARTLMDNAWELLVEVRYRRIRLWTITGANRARHFYESFGFAQTGRTRERDFGDGRPVLEVEYLRSTG
ncbi:MAG: GNAT family N-acetyltransferase [Actinophytocola sp.]|uniref:GNAT family N-acetyltransferase n=1 Tax=Actinophytocola sp. TaxID=1872138 RepID=UPI003C71FDBF